MLLVGNHNQQPQQNQRNQQKKRKRNDSNNNDNNDNNNNTKRKIAELKGVVKYARVQAREDIYWQQDTTM